MTQTASPSENGLEESINRFFPYLLEIRRRILITLCILIIGAILGFVYYEKIIGIIVHFLTIPGVNVVFTSPFQYIDLAVSCGLFIALIISLPFTIYQLLAFLKPALRRREYRLIIYLLPLSIILFAIGFSLGFWMMQSVLNLFYKSTQNLQVGNMLDISKLLSNVLVTASLMGLAFQFPIALTLLLRLKLLKHQQVVKARPLAYAAAMLFAAFMPPTDVLSLILLSVPLVFLFELTLILNRVLLKTHAL